MTIFDDKNGEDFVAFFGLTNVLAQLPGLLKTSLAIRVWTDITKDLSGLLGCGRDSRIVLRRHGGLVADGNLR